MTRRGQPDAAVRHRLVEAAVAIIAADGVQALTAAAITRRAGLHRSTVSRYFGSCDHLLLSAALEIAKGEVLPRPEIGTVDHDPLAALLFLARSHRRSAVRSPERFGALLQLSSAAMFTTPALHPILAARHARVRAVAILHLEQLRELGVIDASADVRAVACGLTGAMMGIEICFQLDADAQIRDAAYRELCAALSDRLTRATGPD